MKIYVDKLPKSCRNCPMLEILHPYGDEDMEISALYCRCNKKQVEVKENDLYLDYHEKYLKKYFDKLHNNCPLETIQSQLAEKEKEIEKLKGIKIIPAPINGEDIKNLNQHYFVIADANEPQVTILDQNQKAIEQLEEVKEFVVGNCGLEPAEGKARIEISKYIKQKINELKGKVEDE